LKTKFQLKRSSPINEKQKGSALTNRWSSRLKGRQELRVLTRKEPRLLAVVGGAAQLYVRAPSVKSTSFAPTNCGSVEADDAIKLLV
jgi:hypothetical protein